MQLNNRIKKLETALGVSKPSSKDNRLPLDKMPSLDACWENLSDGDKEIFNRAIETKDFSRLSDEMLDELHFGIFEGRILYSIPNYYAMSAEQRETFIRASDREIAGHLNSYFTSGDLRRLEQLLDYEGERTLFDALGQ